MKLVRRYMNGGGWPEDKSWERKEERYTPVVFTGGEYNCYSDASCNEHVATYGIIVVRRSIIVAKDSGTLSCDGIHSVAAEMMAMTKALLYVPDGAGGISHSDLVDITQIVQFDASYSPKHVAAIAALKEQLSRTGCVVHFAKRSQRTAYYRQCHRMAAQASGRFRDGVNRKRRKKAREKLSALPDCPVDLWPASLTYQPFQLPQVSVVEE